MPVFRSLTNVFGLNRKHKSTNDITVAEKDPQDPNQLTKKTEENKNGPKKDHGKIFKKSASTVDRITRLNTIISQKDRFGKAESYEKFNKVGAGTYATVFRGYSKILKTSIAIKEIKIDKSEGVPCTTLREISNLRELNHTNIVCLHDIFWKVDKIILIFEFSPFDLKQLMKKYTENIPYQDVIIFMFQLLRGINYCHEKRIIHRDLKPQNILVSSTGIVKIADFGLARSMGVPSKNYSYEVVTLWYRPPDVLLGSTTYDYSIDVWSIGCIISETFTKVPLFAGKDSKTQLESITRILGPITEDNLPGVLTLSLSGYLKEIKKFSIKPGPIILPRAINQNVVPLLLRILSYNPHKRPSVDACLKDVIFSDLKSKISAVENNKMDSSEISATLLSKEFTDIVQDIGKK